MKGLEHPQRIMIIGCCGAGKSTLAKQLHEKQVFIFQNDKEVRQFLSKFDFYEKHL